MATLQPYKKYNAISYDYATELPDGWQLLPNIAIFQERKERGTENEENLTISAIRGIVKSTDYENRKDRTSDDKSQYLLVKEGDLAYNTMLMWDGAVGHSSFRGIVSPAYTVLKAKLKINPKFFHYQMRTEFYKNYSRRFSYGIVNARLRLYYVHFKRMYSIVPPLEVQNSIVAYLDKKNSEIDKFIRNKERLVELLELNRQRKIFDAITKGIDKNIELKESGFPWIGLTPKHWELKKVKSFASHVQRGSSPTYVNESELVVISQASMSSGFIDDAKFKYQAKAKIEHFKGRLFKDDVLLASTGGGVLGKSIVFNRDGNYIADGHLTIIRDKKKRFNSIFLFYFLSINFDFIEGYLGQGSTNQTELQRGWFRDLYLPFPELNEQERIVDFVNEFNEEINSAISKAKKEISSIKEYREALITDLVTGKRSLNCDLE
jgi:type I restriction enzyme S subunit